MLMRSFCAAIICFSLIETTSAKTNVRQKRCCSVQPACNCQQAPMNEFFCKCPVQQDCSCKSETQVEPPGSGAQYMLPPQPTSDSQPVVQEEVVQPFPDRLPETEIKKGTTCQGSCGPMLCVELTVMKCFCSNGYSPCMNGNSCCRR